MSPHGDLRGFVLLVKEPIFEIGAVPGDEILVRPGHAEPVVLIRLKRPTYGELAGAVSNGAAMPVSLPHSEALLILASLASTAQGRSAGKLGVGAGGPALWRPEADSPA